MPISPYMKKIIDDNAPLEKEEQLVLIEKAKAGDIDARNTLILTNLRLVVLVMRRYDHYILEDDDFLAESVPAFDYAIKKYDPEKGPWPTFLTQAIVWRFNDLQNRLGPEMETLNQSAYGDPSGDHLKGQDKLDLVPDLASERYQREEESRSDLMALLPHLPPVKQKVLIMTLGLFEFPRYKLKTIGDHLGMLGPQVSFFKTQSIEILQSMVDSNDPPEYELIDIEGFRTEVKNLPVKTWKGKHNG